MSEPLISVCMPIYNAAAYLAQAIEGILNQTYSNWELIICDNQSSDASVEIAHQYANRDARIRIYQNHWNIGFSGNAHKTTTLARGDFLIIHAGDDVAKANAFDEYVMFINRFINQANSLILLSDFDLIDQSGQLISTISSNQIAVRPIDHEPASTAMPEYFLYNGHTILCEKLHRLHIFGWVGSVLFSKELLTQTEGYSSNQWVNPDKQFIFKALSLNPNVICIKKSLFKYRIHNFNQNSQQKATGVLKYLLDQYAYTFDLPDDILHEYARGREALIEQFIEHDCLRSALRNIALGNRKHGFRHLCFALATYPDVAKRNAKTYAALVLWGLGPIGIWIAKRLYRHYMNANPERFTNLGIEI